MNDKTNINQMSGQYKANEITIPVTYEVKWDGPHKDIRLMVAVTELINISKSSGMDGSGMDGAEVISVLKYLIQREEQ